MVGRLDVTEIAPIGDPLPDLRPGRPATFSWGGLSPEAEKAQFEAAGRMRGWWPYLARTQSKAVVMRPRSGGWQHRRAFAQAMGELLPGFSFNSKANRWEADLAELEAAYEALAPEVVLSDGAREILEVTQ